MFRELRINLKLVDPPTSMPHKLVKPIYLAGLLLTALNLVELLEALLSISVLPQPFNHCCMPVNNPMMGIIFGLLAVYFKGRVRLF